MKQFYCFQEGSTSFWNIPQSIRYNPRADLDTIPGTAQCKFNNHVNLAVHLHCIFHQIKMFFEEHFHTDEEIRFILEGSGYFDVRDSRDHWIRIEVMKGDMILLPAGIFHRFTISTEVS